MNVFVTPFEIVDNTLVRQLFLQNENVLEKVYYSFLDIEMIEFCYHSLLILQVFLILVNERISLINDLSDVIKYCSITTFFK
jgi:hypothetical protein